MSNCTICWHQHYMNKCWNCCTGTEKIKRTAIASVIYIGALVLLALIYLASTFRWSL